MGWFIFTWAVGVVGFIFGMIFYRNVVVAGIETGPIARGTVIAWASSGGFAAVHDTGGTPENITDDMIGYLKKHGLAIVRVSAPH
jgi:hypothetical protein